MAHYDVCFVLIYDDKVNKYTANVLIAAIESYARYTKLFLMPLDKIANYVQELTLLNEKCRKLIVGLTFMTTQIDEIRNIVPNLRKTIPKALFIAGGAHASGDPYGTLTRLGFDIIVYGEGEATVVDILNSVYNDEDINSVRYRIY
uniref:B12-binding domain-containing protein n=1 Tax=Ignisphaera aggregans TaxID=334771 RepID=A0A7C2V900_9CREN